ncbi:hypothetical protein D5687_10395 [Guyparkeria sp. SCN-R1]|uniref:hypothetical protein n=1 Tax=Guyparkeria sp. SCN-R1 TaxID=2341113 RepID=UPI000F645A0E|nr:hypothetical protein [Guyparkeria sp. SCN-R1]RRQ20237.1 hypothetical protein D5687_10395 [Guyparkeria sp. SCN-R1]
MKNVVCMKWGDAYTAQDVNTLYGMVARNITPPFRFACFTDDASGIRDEVETHPLPEVNVPAHRMHEAWRKLGTFTPDLGGMEGDALFLDLDIVIRDSLDPFFEHPGDFCIIHNWTHPDRVVGNSSVYRFKIGDLSWVLDRYNEDPEKVMAERRNEQIYLTETLHESGYNMVYWPAEWCVSFKKHCMPHRLLAPFIAPREPKDAKIVVFHGHPKPDEAIRGEWKGKWKWMRPTPWVAEHWH